MAVSSGATANTLTRRDPGPICRALLQEGIAAMGRGDYAIAARRFRSPRPHKQHIDIMDHLPLAQYSPGLSKRSRPTHRRPPPILILISRALDIDPGSADAKRGLAEARKGERFVGPGPGVDGSSPPADCCDALYDFEGRNESELSAQPSSAGTLSALRCALGQLRLRLLRHLCTCFTAPCRRATPPLTQEYGTGRSIRAGERLEVVEQTSEEWWS